MISDRQRDFDETPGTLERRLGPRRRVFLAGRALIGDDRIVDITFRDISERGARLLAPPPTILAGLIPLVLLREALLLRAHVIWRQAPMFGVSFDEAIDLQSLQPGEYEPLVSSWKAWRAAQAE